MSDIDAFLDPSLFPPDGEGSGPHILWLRRRVLIWELAVGLTPSYSPLDLTRSWSPEDVIVLADLQAAWQLVEENPLVAPTGDVNLMTLALLAATPFPAAWSAV